MTVIEHQSAQLPHLNYPIIYTPKHLFFDIDISNLKPSSSSRVEEKKKSCLCIPHRSHQWRIADIFIPSSTLICTGNPISDERSLEEWRKMEFVRLSVGSPEGLVQQLLLRTIP
ncbi:hypothetical protein NPIL_209831 [Nephila pilipes]|uniref:Uncharacterized protein n=1 Tax=Nephila pilipes TaxID=299642 RepID=A0A8X6PDZ2_NEPPI|nr:hypothetical protein NPIL_209831 [Nephila pilipes]